MVTGGILAMNPVSAVRGPKYVIKKGKRLNRSGGMPLFDEFRFVE
jgi:hypothetical protein